MSSASILLVDDEADVRNSLADALRADGYTVETAPSVKGALAWMEACHFSVVVTDLQMPGGPSGLELIAAIKARDPKVLCIVMTGYASVDSAIDAIKHGAYDFLRKPFRLEELEAALDRSLEFSIMQSLLANYQNALETRMVIRMTEMKAYQDESLEITSRLKLGLRESSPAEAMRPLLNYMERRFQPEGYAVIHRDQENALRSLAQKGNWPEAQVLARGMRQHSEGLVEGGHAYPEEHRCPLEKSAWQGPWIFLGFSGRSAFQCDDPLFRLWSHHLAVLLEARGLLPLDRCR